MTPLGRRTRFVAVGLTLAALLPVAPPVGAQVEPPYQGFGAVTQGGAGKPIVRVTTLLDAGPGSLRAALDGGGNRTIVFDVAGEIRLRDFLWVRGPFVTIDGHSAPPPGITLSGSGLIVRGNRGARDVIVRGLRIRGSPVDGLQIAFGAERIIVDHVSIHGSGDGNLDITEDSRDITVSWSILAEPGGDGKNMLIKYNASRVTLHHNLFVSARQRNPQARVNDAGTPATDVTVDMRNNVVWDWRNGSGALVWFGAIANVVNNYFGSPASGAAPRTRAVIVCAGECEGGAAGAARAWVHGNASWDGRHALINGENTETQAFDAAAVDTEPSCLAAVRVIADAGARPLDALDAGYVRTVDVVMCQQPR